MELNRFVILGSLFVILVLGGYACARQVLQHRADYPDGVTFVGEAYGLFGSRYTRLFWHRPRTGDLPDVTLHVNGQAYQIQKLTSEQLGEIAGPHRSDWVQDAEGNKFQAKFEGGHLIHFTLEEPNDRTRPSEDDVASVGLSMGNGEVFVMPITSWQLRHYAGDPQRTYLFFAQ